MGFSFAMEMTRSAAFPRRLFILLVLLMRDAAYASCDIPILCEQRTSFYILGTNSSCLSLSFPSMPPDSICVHVSSSESFMYCLDTAPAEHLHLTLPHALRGLVPVDLLTSSKSQSSLQNADRQYHYMKAIAAPQLSSHLQITIPAYGAVLASPEEIRLNFAGEPFDQVVCKLKDLDDVILSNGTRAIRAAQIEVGSWFFEIVPVRRNPLRGGFPSYGYMEYVLSPYDIASQRLFYAHQSHTAEQAAWYSALSTQFHHHRLDERQSNRTGGNDQIDVCIWSYNKIDGQSRIWLTQTELMRDRFRFSWVLNAKGRSIAALQAQSRESLAGTVLDALFAFPDVQVADNPFQYVLFNQTALSEVPVDGGPLAADSMVGDSQDRQDAINRYIRGRFLSADKQIDQVSPLWCREIYQQVRQVLLDLQCDIVVYGNNRGRSTDYLITDTARTLGIPSVTELVNLFMHEDVVPDVIVAPSHFALLHESVQKMLKASEMNDHRPPVSVVISPAVDLKHFQPPLLRNSQKSCQVMNDASQRACVTVGFLGRVTSSKNPGLFMQAAYHILQSFAFARFVIIGDGSLRKDLEELAERLQIVDKVEFRGFVSYKNLPDHLADIDVLINTSLGGFWETFCISNIEAMAMEIPMVTFAIGGIGEYIKRPVPSNVTEPWSVVDNAVIVNVADPQVLAAATLHLITHPPLRRSIGAAGRRSLEGHFTVDRQIAQYSALYQAAYDATIASTPVV